MNNIQVVKISIQNESNYYISMKILNSIKNFITKQEYNHIKEKLKNKYKPVYALASGIIQIKNRLSEGGDYEKN